MNAAVTVREPTSTSCAPVQVIRTVSDLQALEGDWNSLLIQSDADPLFLSWDWVQDWLESFNKSDLFVVCVRDHSQKLLGIAPFYRCGWPEDTRGLCILRMIGDRGDAVGLGNICRRDHEVEFAAALIDGLSSITGWHALALDDLAENLSNRAFLQELRSRSSSIRERTTPNQVVTLPPSWDEFLETLSRKHRANLRRATQRSGKHEAEFSRAESAAEVREAMEGLIRLHTARWGTRGAFASEHRTKFYRQISEKAFRSRTLDLWTMRISGHLVAVEFGFRIHNRRIALQSGFDPVFAKSQVGALLEARVIEESIRAGITQYDFLGGSQPFKSRWGASVGKYHSLRASAGGIGRAWVGLSSAKQTGTDWLRRIRGSAT